jgi:hypothetical protein
MGYGYQEMNCRQATTWSFGSELAFDSKNDSLVGSTENLLMISA